MYSTDTLQTLAQTVYQRCEQLAAISCLHDGVGRYYLTPEHRACNAQVHAWMRNAGLTTWTDNAGNCWGRVAAEVADAPVVILGSHLDTVAMAGKYDGILGVLSALAVAELLRGAGVQLPFHLDIVGFGDEEGTRFGATLLGSAAVAGKWQNRWFDLTDSEGVSLAQALTDFGLNPAAMSEANRSGDNILAYLELHIEQGPVLEQAQLPVGVVTAIAGARRFEFSLKGLAGHAGTVPMAMRQDPLVAAALLIARIESLALDMGLVATVGKIQALPGAVNVIPGECRFSLDIRSGDDQLRDSAIDHIHQTANDLCQERNIAFSSHQIHAASAVACAEWLQAATAESIVEQSLQPLSLMSGAGHDAMVFADMTDIGMLFVRCTGGISHNPLEAVTVADVAAGLGVFAALVQKLAARVG